MPHYRNKHDINPPEPCTSVFYSAVRCKFWPYFSIDHFSAVSSVVPTAYLYPSIAHCDTALQCFKGTVQFPSPSDFGLFSDPSQYSAHEFRTLLTYSPKLNEAQQEFVYAIKTKKYVEQT